MISKIQFADEKNVEEEFCMIFPFLFKCLFEKEQSKIKKDFKILRQFMKRKKVKK